MKRITESAVRRGVRAAVRDIIREYRKEPDTDRETLIERMDQETDTLFGQLGMQGRIDAYDADYMVQTAQPCATIIKVAQDDAWVEDDSGLWDGLTFGVLASIAYFSLRNLVYEALKAKGYDSNQDRPFARK